MHGFKGAWRSARASRSGSCGERRTPGLWGGLRGGSWKTGSKAVVSVAGCPAATASALAPSAPPAAPVRPASAGHLQQQRLTPQQQQQLNAQLQHRLQQVQQQQHQSAFQSGGSGSHGNAACSAGWCPKPAPAVTDSPSSAWPSRCVSPTFVGVQPVPEAPQTPQRTERAERPVPGPPLRVRTPKWEALEDRSWPMLPRCSRRKSNGGALRKGSAKPAATSRYSAGHADDPPEFSAIHADQGDIGGRTAAPAAEANKSRRPPRVPLMRPTPRQAAVKMEASRPRSCEPFSSLTSDWHTPTAHYHQWPPQWALTS